MSYLEVCLFGKVEFAICGQPVCTLDSRKNLELLCYLLLYRERSHARESLAGLLWGDQPTSQARNYLRKALWHLQSSLDVPCDPNPVLLVDPEWIQVNLQAEIWLDVANFETSFHLVKGIHGRDLTPELERMVLQAVDLYRGDLMEGWFLDWSLHERERLQFYYLAMLDKLMDYNTVRQNYDAGVDYGNRILLYDRAREHTHRKLMRLHALAGDRTSAIKQYQRCTDALQDELDVGPSSTTQQLYEFILNDRLVTWSKAENREESLSLEPLQTGLELALKNISQVQIFLNQLDGKIQKQSKTNGTK